MYLYVDLNQLKKDVILGAFRVVCDDLVIFLNILCAGEQKL